MNKVYSLIIILLTGIFLSGCGADAAVETQEDSPIAIELATVIKDEVEETYVTIGEVVTKLESLIYISEPGKVDAIMVQTGEKILEDTPLIQMVDNDGNTAMLYSDIPGYIAGIYVKENEKSMNQVAIKVIDVTELYVKTFVTGALKKDLFVGQDIQLTVEGNTQDMIGQIHSINGTPDEKNKLFEVMILLNNEMEMVSVGDYAEVTFVTEERTSLMIPAESIIRDGTDKYIYVYANKRVQKVNVETGLSKDTYVEILVGKVSEGDFVVIRGQNNITEQDQVQVIQ